MQPKTPIFKAKVKGTSKGKASAKREAFLRQSEKAVKISFLDGITRFKQKLSLDKLGAMYEARDYKGLDKHIGWDDVEANLGGAKSAVGEAYDKTMSHAVNSISQDEVNPKYIANVQGKATQQKLKMRQRDFLQDIKGSRKSVHALVADGLKTGRSPRAVARDIKEQITLNPRQIDALAAFRKNLERKGLTPSAIQRRVEAKERKSLNYRANMIAITETRVAAAAAEQTVWEAQVKDGLLPKDILKVWLCEPDACDAICRPMDGVTVPLNDLWTLPSGDKSSPGSAHVNCRCAQDIQDPA